MQVEGCGIGTGFEARRRVAAIPDRRFSVQEEARADALAGATRRDIKRCHSVLIHFDPSDRSVLNSDPHRVMQYRPRDTIRRCSIRPLLSLRSRHRSNGEFEDGAAPNRGQRRVVTGVGASNPCSAPHTVRGSPSARVRTHCMTSSACCRTDCGIASRRTLAAFRLMTSSNLVGRSIGRSAGFAPRRMRSTYTAARWNRSSRPGP